MFFKKLLKNLFFYIIASVLALKSTFYVAHLGNNLKTNTHFIKEFNLYFKPTLIIPIKIPIYFIYTQINKQGLIV